MFQSTYDSQQREQNLKRQRKSKNNGEDIKVLELIFFECQVINFLLTLKILVFFDLTLHDEK